MGKVYYNAFISYSHNERDTYIAKKLHFMLEHYRIPRKISSASGKTHFTRVFRDQEELTLSSNLTEDIKEALENSEFLIVICSPKAAQSMWVEKEIELFLRSHDRNKVLLVLADGEPEDAFPDIIKKYTEPMAGDVRGNNKREINKKMKTEILRIIAPMLSCTYDSLKQRHREYLLQRIIAGLSAVAVLTVLFALYALDQRQQINDRYEEARRNQARYLCEISDKLLKSGDRIGALKTALAIGLEDDKETEPVVPEQVYALNNSLYTYDYSGSLQFKPDTIYELEGQVHYTDEDERKNGVVSQNGTEYFCIDRMGTAYILNTEDGECIWKISPQDILETIDDEFIYFQPVSDEKAVLISTTYIIYVDWKTQRVEKQIKTDELLKIGTLLCAAQESKVAIANGNSIAIYDIEQGKCIQNIKYSSEDDSYYYQPNSIVFRPDGKEVAVGVSAPQYESAEGKRGGIFRISLEDGNVTSLCSQNTETLIYLDNKTVAAIHSQYATEEEPSGFWYDNSYFVALYSMSDEKSLFYSEKYKITDITVPCYLSVETMEVLGDKQEVLIASINNNIIFYNPDTGEKLIEKNFDTGIVGFCKYDETRILVGFADGSIKNFVPDNQERFFAASMINTEVSEFTYCPETDTVIQAQAGSHNIIFSRCIHNKNAEMILKNAEIRDVEYYSVETNKGDTEIYRYVTYVNNDDSLSIAIYKAGDSKELALYSLKSPSFYVKNVEVREVNQQPIMFLSISDYDAIELVAINLQTGSIQTIYKNKDNDEWNNCSIKIFHDGNRALVFSRDRFAIGEVNESGISLPDVERESYPADEIEDAVVSYDDKYIVFVTSDSADMAFYQQIRIWDIANEKWQRLEDNLSVKIKKDSFDIGRSSNKIVYYTENGTIDTMDFEKGELLCSITYGQSDSLEISFINTDQYLITYSDNINLTLWDVTEGKMLMEEETGTEFIGHIYVDGSSKFFGIKNSFMGVNDAGISTQELKVYSLEESGRFYHFADIPYGYASFEAEEFFCAGGHGCYYGDFLDYKTLENQAEKILGDEKLSLVEKRKYYISE